MIFTPRNGWVFAGLALGLCACGEKKQTTAPATPEPPVEVIESGMPTTTALLATSDLAVAEMPAVEGRDRANVLGFARHLPAGVEGLITVQHVAKTVESVKQMKLWKSFGDELTEADFSPQEAGGEGDFSDLDGIMHEEDFAAPAGMMSPMEMLGREVTLALGEGGGERLAAWLRLNGRSTHYQMRNLAAMLTGKPVTGGPPALGGLSMLATLFSSMSDTRIYGDLVQDREAMRALDAFQMPPIYVAVRAEGEAIHQVHAILSEPVRSLTNFGEVVAPVEVTRAGATFQGYRLIGAEFAASMADAREVMAEVFGEEVFDRFIEFLKTRDLVAMSGTIGEYAVLFFGASPDEFQLAESPEQALTHGDALAFADPLLEHPQIALVHGGESLIQQLIEGAGGLAEIALGLRDGFASNDRDGRNRDLVALLDLVADRERALRAMATHNSSGIVLVDDGGPRLEAHGGTSGMLDYTSPSRFAALGDDPDAVMFFNWCSDPQYDAKSLAYSEALLETGYALTMRLMDSQKDPAESSFDRMAFARHLTTMFANDFRGDVVNLWRAVAHDVRNGLGQEAAIVVDLKGTVPTLPGAAKPLAGIANSPRVAYLAPVVDRENLAAAWQSIHENSHRIVTRIAEMNDREIPVPNAIRSETNGLSSWFLPLPFFDDEFLPSVTLNDSWFAIGTSRNQSIELIQRLEGLESRDGGGMRFSVNFPRIVEAQRGQLAALKEKRAAILEAGEIDETDFDEVIKQGEALIYGLEDFDRLEGRWWREDGVYRSSIHLKMN